MQKETHLPQSKEALIQAINDGLMPKYLFFWGHQSNRSSVIGKYCLSQWYIAPFEIDSIIYLSAEHFMMAEKARLFNDDIILNKILNSAHPGEAKLLGRQVNNFNQQVWENYRFTIAVNGNTAKFQQNKEIGTFLINTLNRILVEASPLDKIWGVGLSEDHIDVSNPSSWLGLNLLGFVLMKVRKDIC